jgi:hypothetical protein
MMINIYIFLPLQSGCFLHACYMSCSINILVLVTKNTVVSERCIYELVLMFLAISAHLSLHFSSVQILSLAIHSPIRGVFKKRPTFLNSGSTSKESALRLLNAGFDIKLPFVPFRYEH